MVRRRFQRGSLFKRGKREKVWVARWWEDVINAEGTTGRMRRSIVIGTVAEFTTRRLALRALSDRLRSLNGGSQRPQTVRTLKHFVQMDWEPVVLPTLKYATQTHYKYMLGAHLIPTFGERRLPDISREAIQTFLAAKLREGFAWETVHHIKCALSKVLGTAEEWDYISDNPVRKTRLPRREFRSEQSILTTEQIKQLLAALPEPSNSVATLLVLTGLRIGELLALRRKSIDLAARALRITETVYDGHFDSPKTRRSVRSIPIGSESISILSALLSKTGEPDSLIFSTCSGQPLCRRNLLHRHLQPTCLKLGLPKITWHSLRHCHATLLDAVGAPLGTVQALLGHASSEITRQIYLHAIPAEQRRAVDGVEKLLIGPKWTQVAGVMQSPN
ncbi:MAG TPA: tyrosine-type recombinase/integrase [Candidatus Acidoferrum sp.]|jgi:integrase|nr:tyrosine-type recombinase/integrase [Candidatus Acidoferrum sp.]